MENESPIQELGRYQNNNLYIKREDMVPYSFGGNKARKGILFFKDIDQGQYDCVVTYGSSHSNHCRIIANMAASRKMECYIIGPSEVSEQTFNSKFMELFGAELTLVPVEAVHDTIEEKLKDLKKSGKKPYFIPGGGHGNIGTEAYVQCYNEIKSYEYRNNIKFDYIFFASGTGTTHSGLVCGQLINKDETTIVGISIARKNPRGRDIVIDSIQAYLSEKNNKISNDKISNDKISNDKISNDEVQEKTIFIDEYTGSGYGKDNSEIIQTIKDVMISYGIPLDSTYTGKAFWGMSSYLSKNNIIDKNILFLHTGGTPLFFDDFMKM